MSAKDTTDKNAFAATLTIQLPVDVYRDHIVVVRKEGSAPASMSDGTVVYTGKETSVRDTTGTNYGIDYHWAVYTVNAEGTACDTPARANLSLKPIVPEQVTQTSAADASAPEYGYRVLVKTKIPADVNAYKIMVRRKAGEMPATSIDGDLAYEGSNDTFYDLPPFSTQAYHYRVFTVNQAGQLNDKQEGATASVTLTAKEPGAVTNLAATDEKGTTTGSFDLPVVMVEGREAVNRFVTGYVVIQKEGGTPTTEKDGEVIATAEIDPKVTGKTVQFTKVGQKNGANLFITVFLKNHVGSYFWSNGQTVNLVPNVFPAEPTGWSEMQKYTTSTTFTAPEDGWFKFIGVAKSGEGGNSNTWTDPNGKRWRRGGGGGGAGGIVVSVFALTQGQTVTLTVGSYATIQAQGQTATAGAGSDGYDAATGDSGGRGGRGGSASGGNLVNKAGASGGTGGFEIGLEEGGWAGTNSYEGYSTAAGMGLPSKNYKPNPAYGYIVALRGNTNLTQAQLNAMDITTLMLDNSRLEQEVTGIMLSQSAQ